MPCGVSVQPVSVAAIDNPLTQLTEIWLNAPGSDSWLIQPYVSVRVFRVYYFCSLISEVSQPIIIKLCHMIEDDSCL